MGYFSNGTEGEGFVEIWCSKCAHWAEPDDPKQYPVTRGEWRTIGKSAGILRNARMLAEGTPDLCVAFTGGRGTADMVGRCKSAGVLVYDPITNTVS